MILGTLLLGLMLGGIQAAQVEGDMESAQKYMQARDFRKAIEVLEAVVKREQAPPADVFILLSTSHLNVKETNRALEVFERGMSLYPQQALLEEFYVKLLADYVPIQQMKDKLEKALAASPRSPFLLRAAAFVEMRLDIRGERARQMVAKFVEVAPDDPNSHYVYGQWARLNHQEELAIAEWEKTLSLTTADARMQMDVYTLIGDAENRLNRAEQAEAAFKKAFEANSSLEDHNSASAFFYADFLAKQARFDESHAIIEQILLWTPTYGPALLEQAIHLTRVKKPEEAVVAAEKALVGTDLTKDQTRAAHVLLGKTYFLLKRIPDAERHQQWLKAQ